MNRYYDWRSCKVWLRCTVRAFAAMVTMNGEAFDNALDDADLLHRAKGGRQDP